MRQFLILVNTVGVPLEGVGGQIYDVGDQSPGLRSDIGNIDQHPPLQHPADASRDRQFSAAQLSNVLNGLQPDRRSHAHQRGRGALRMGRGIDGHAAKTRKAKHRCTDVVLEHHVTPRRRLGGEDDNFAAALKLDHGRAARTVKSELGPTLGDIVSYLRAGGRAAAAKHLAEAINQFPSGRQTRRLRQGDRRNGAGRQNRAHRQTTGSNRRHQQALAPGSGRILDADKRAAKWSPGSPEHGKCVPRKAARQSRAERRWIS